MNTEKFERKLSAILSADVKGYSRLMRADEDETIRTVTSYRTAIAMLVEQYRGRVVDSPGDNVLAEFGSGMDAVNCAVEIQRELAERNEGLSDKRKMEFRIGVNSGDVVQEGNRIYGDGVNIAARVEGLAEGGGICVSGTVYDSIEGKLGLEFENLGEHEVKNIDKSIRIFRVLSFLGAPAQRSVEPASEDKMAFPLPDKPSIAVLPFLNMSGDPKQEYIADGITENITTALSKIQEMFVIARTSTMTYKGKSVTVKQVSEELGVRYVLEGSVQKEGQRVRITAQLVDAIKGNHLWAERYDRDMKGFFDLLDEITKEIGAALQIQLTWGDYARFTGSTDNFEAWGLFNEAYSRYQLAINERRREDNVKARELFEKAFKLDPGYASALNLMAWTHLTDVLSGWSKSPQKSIQRAVELAKKARTLGASSAGFHSLWSMIYSTKRQYERAIKEAEKAIAQDPNFPVGYISLWVALYSLGKFEEAIPVIKTAMRLHGPYFSSNHLEVLANAYMMVGHYEKAISTYNKYFDRCKTESCLKFGHLGLANTYIWIGQEEEARNHAEEVLKIDPKFSLEGYAVLLPFKNQADTDRVIDALRKAGLK